MSSLNYSSCMDLPVQSCSLCGLVWCRTCRVKIRTLRKCCVSPLHHCTCALECGPVRRFLCALRALACPARDRQVFEHKRAPRANLWRQGPINKIKTSSPVISAVCRQCITPSHAVSNPYYFSRPTSSSEGFLLWTTLFFIHSPHPH